MGRANRRKRSSGGLRASTKKSNAGAEIAKELIKLAVESGELPWHRPWEIAGLPRNAFSEREYRGINIFYLGLIASLKGYESSRWMTYKQAAEASFQQWRKEKGLADNKESRRQYKEDLAAYSGVRKGEKATPIVFFKSVPKKENGKVVLDDNGRPEMRRVRASYQVFNAEQTDLQFPKEEVKERGSVQIIDSAEEIVQGFKGGPKIEHGGDKACYIPGQDIIRMPRRERFHSDEDYYKVLFHEMIHSTGHSSRTDRTKGDWSGMESYAEEELVAEIGASILSFHAGIRSGDDAKKHSAAYIQSWMKKLTDDPELFLRASTRAQTAVDYILGTQFDE